MTIHAPTPEPHPEQQPKPQSKTERNTKPKQRDEPGAERGDGRFPRGLALRLFVYIVAGHLLAGFLYLLFKVGGAE